MDSSVSQKDQFWFLRVCLHVPIQLYLDVSTRKCAQNEGGNILFGGDTVENEARIILTCILGTQAVRKETDMD